jgi:hypothetical protein
MNVGHLNDFGHLNDCRTPQAKHGHERLLLQEPLGKVAVREWQVRSELCWFRSSFIGRRTDDIYG